MQSLDANVKLPHKYNETGCYIDLVESRVSIYPLKQAHELSMVVISTYQIITCCGHYTCVYLLLVCCQILRCEGIACKVLIHKATCISVHEANANVSTHCLNQFRETIAMFDGDFHYARLCDVHMSTMYISFLEIGKAVMMKFSFSNIVSYFLYVSHNHTSNKHVALFAINLVSHFPIIYTQTCSKLVKFVIL